MELIRFRITLSSGTLHVLHPPPPSHRYDKTAAHLPTYLDSNCISLSFFRSAFLFLRPHCSHVGLLSKHPFSVILCQSESV